MQSWIFENLRIWGLGHQGNLQICDLGINQYKFVDLQLRNTPKNFSDLQFADKKNVCVNQ
jgi:hypothetical protein